MKNMTEVNHGAGTQQSKREMAVNAKSANKYPSANTMNNLTPSEPNGRVSASDIRADFLEMGAEVVREVCRQARGEEYDMTVDQSTRDDVFKAMLPMLNAAGDKIYMGNLASLDPVERANKVLEAVATGSMSPKQAMELVGLMKTLAELDGSLQTSDDDAGGKLVINLAQMPDNTLAKEVKDAIPSVARKIK